MPRIGREADKDRQSTMHCKKSDEYEVEKLVDICFGDPTKTGKRGLKLKVNLYSKELHVNIL